MTNGSSQGLFVVVAVVIFGIFVAISYSLFRDTLTPSLASIFSDSIFNTIGNVYGTIATLNDLKTSDSTIANIEFKNKSTLIFSHDGSNISQNVYLSPSFFKTETKYILEYEIEILDGVVETLGGHSSSFEGGLDLSTPQNFYIDGELKGNYYKGVLFKLNKGKKHKVKVLLDTSNISSENLQKNLGVYIQPNRRFAMLTKNQEYTQKQSPPYKVKVENLMLYEV